MSSLLERAAKQPRMVVRVEAGGHFRKSFAKAPPLDADDLGVGEPPASHDAQSDLEWLSTGTGAPLKGVTEDLVRQYVLGVIDPEDVVPLKLVVCGTAVDRDNEQFSLEVLEDFAETLPGKSLLVGHDWSGLGVGRVVAAALQDRPDGEVQLVCLAYMVKGTGHDDLIRLVEAGVVWACSIGFWCEQRVIDSDGVGVYVGKAEALEVSLVFLGSQRGAEVTKAFENKARCEQCGHAEASCALDREFVDVELDVARRELKMLRSGALSLDGRTFAEVHERIRRLEREQEATA